MTYVVTWWCMRYGELQERPLYVGRSRMLARLVMWFARGAFLQGVDVLTLDARSES